jgi:hypothetical protein
MQRTLTARHLRSLIPYASARREPLQQRQTDRPELAEGIPLLLIDADSCLRIRQDLFLERVKLCLGIE